MSKFYNVLFSLVVFFTVPSLGQTKKVNSGGFEFQVSSVDIDQNAAFCAVGQMPEFPGGMSNLVRFTKSKIHYPQSAINDNIEGSVVIQFAINRKGKVYNRKVSKRVRDDLDTICLKMLNQMPNWKPAQLNGKTIAVNLDWKITFVLSG